MTTNPFETVREALNLLREFESAAVSPQMPVKAINALATLDLIEQQTQWRPISEAPKDGTAFLCGWWSADKAYWWTCKAHWANGAVDGGWDGAREPVKIDPTHFMPLPSPPKEGA